MSKPVMRVGGEPPVLLTTLGRKFDPEWQLVREAIDRLPCPQAPGGHSDWVELAGYNASEISAARSAAHSYKRSCQTRGDDGWSLETRIRPSEEGSMSLWLRKKSDETQ